MMRLLYPLIASALITIAPFLLTFEKGQDIVRGLFGYSEFALLLLFVLVKTRFHVFEGAPDEERDETCSGEGHDGECSHKGGRTRCWRLFRGVRPGLSLDFFKVVAPMVLLAILFALMVVVAWIDLQNLLAIKGRPTGWYGVLPFATCAFAVAMLWKTRGFSLPAVSFILFVSLVAHLAAYNYYAAQPLAQFPVVDYMARMAPKPVERKKLPEDFAVRYAAAIKSAGVDFTAAETATAEVANINTAGSAAIAVTDSPSVARNFVDTARSNVMVLVESWGTPMDPARFAEEIAVFKGIPMQVGVHHRMYSRTRTAEREDLISSWRRDTTGRRDTTFLPSEFTKRGFATTFLFGGDSAEQWRYKYIRNVGFENVVWGAEKAENADVAESEKTTGGKKLGTATRLADATMMAKIDSMLSANAADSVESKKLFIAFTTGDTKFPLPEFNDLYSGAADAVDSAYTVRLMGSLRLVADLARKYPDVRFVVQGDHDPILSPLAFQERFYKRWVPYVVLN